MFIQKKERISWQAQKTLGIKFRDPVESLKEMVYVMIQRGQIRAKDGFKGVPEKYQEFADLENLAKNMKNTNQ